MSIIGFLETLVVNHDPVSELIKPLLGHLNSAEKEELESGRQLPRSVTDWLTFDSGFEVRDREILLEVIELAILVTTESNPIELSTTEGILSALTRDDITLDDWYLVDGSPFARQGDQVVLFEIEDAKARKRVADFLSARGAKNYLSGDLTVKPGVFTRLRHFVTAVYRRWSG